VPEVRSTVDVLTSGNLSVHNSNERSIETARLGIRAACMGTASIPQNGTARFDRRLGEILACAARVFSEKGYDGASIRDISRACETSLAGLYYYFSSKEELLYTIQKDAFELLIARLEERLATASDPEQRLRATFDNHLAYALEEPSLMKVLSHEDETLGGPRGAAIASLKRRYYKLCLGVVEELHPTNGRVAVMSLFGMINWIYTWHDPRKDPAAAGLGEQMAGLFLHGIQRQEKHNERNGHGGNRKTTGQLQRGAGRRGDRNGRSAGQHLHA